MGEVWKALDTTLDREVALKILTEEVTDNADRLAAFDAEAKAVASLNHPNIVTIHSVEQVDGVYFIAMEFVRGTPLSEMIPKTGFDPVQFLDLALPIVDAVHAAHERGVTHRDLKPANVMVGDDGRCKVLDFGLALFVQSDSALSSDQLPTRSLTMHSEIRGTLPYMSPEQLLDKPLDHRTDLFSLGVMLYELATGERPFKGDTPAELIASILRDYPRPLTELNELMPAELQRVVMHCMQKDRDRRQQSALTLRKQLEAVKEELDTIPVSRATIASAGHANDLSSVAVLPLRNHAAGEDQDFFGDGMTEALITGLAKIEGLKVISRTSVMLYKNSKKPLKEIAGELGVGAIVEGSVLRLGDRVRITAQLIDARSDRHLWAESYSREISDLFELQSEVAHAIASQVRVKLTPQDRTRLDVKQTVNPEAHEAYLKGRFFWYERTPESVKKGLECFQRATRLDPAFAPAWAGIADSYLVDGGGYLGLAAEEAYGRAREAAEKALELDETLAEAHTSLAGVVTDYDWNWAGGDEAYSRAIALNPNYVTARYWYADHLVRLGRVDEAIREARRALEIDPLSLMTNFMLVWVFYFSRRYDEAIEQAEKTLELGPRYVPLFRVLGWAREERGQHEKAIEAHQRASELSDDNIIFRAQLGRPYALAGMQDKARAVLEDLTSHARSEHVGAHDLAILHAALGEADPAFEWLTRACDDHDVHVPYIKVNPRLDRLRSDPRFGDKLSQVGLDR